MTEEKEFVVRDRRRFSPDTEKSQNDEAEKEARKEHAAEPESADAAAGVSGADEKKDEAAKKEPRRMQLPEIDFSTFILSLNSSALMQLGLIEDPVTGKKEKDLPLAKQTIDILGMLDEKTKGNLTRDEEMMLKNILYDLRMMYVREMR